MRREMDWVILAGTVGHEVPWTRGLPRPLLPLPQATLLDALMHKFRNSSPGSCTICANGHTELYTNYVLGEGRPDHGVGFFEDSIPRGPAGCLKACENRLTGAPILVIGGSVWLDDQPERMLAQHRAAGNTLTVFCTQEKNITPSRSAALLKPAGVYCCEPEVLSYIQPEGYQDLKEQLIPALQRSGRRVGAVALIEETCEVSDWPTYLRVLQQVLSSERFDTADYRQLAKDIWVGRDADIADSARLVGPVVIGHRCTLGAGTAVVGPAIIGDDCRIGEDSWLIRVVLPNELHCPDGTSIIDQLVPPVAPEPVG
ncbi:MAG: sugar phosphate nucleotidyltransferase [Phycisphaerae bacterium]